MMFACTVDRSSSQASILFCLMYFQTAKLWNLKSNLEFIASVIPKTTIGRAFQFRNVRIDWEAIVCALRPLLSYRLKAMITVDLCMRNWGSEKFWGRCWERLSGLTDDKMIHFVWYYFFISLSVVMTYSFVLLMMLKALFILWVNKIRRSARSLEISVKCFMCLWCACMRNCS